MGDEKKTPPTQPRDSSTPKIYLSTNNKGGSERIITESRDIRAAMEDIKSSKKEKD